MSADNYVVVRKFDDGWRWAQGFASDEEESPSVASFSNGPFSCQFDAQDDAIIKLSIIEYGIHIERPQDKE